jgi:hypothetical protein
MVPISAVLIIGDDEDAVTPDRAALDQLDDVGGMAVAGEDAPVARMLVLDADRLIKRDR